MLIIKPSRYGHVGYFEVSVRGSHQFTKYLDVVKGIPSRAWDKSISNLVI